MSRDLQYSREDSNVQPPSLYPNYKSTTLRSPTAPLIRIPQTLTETTGPAGGWDRLMGAALSDLTSQHKGVPIGQRIVEIPENLERTELRDDSSGFVAYVPVGSIKKGQTLVKTGGGGKTVQCGVCHGDDLKGLGPIPGIAGRSPSYIARQLYDMQTGARNGAWAPLMKAAVAKLTPEDLVSISAYAASLAP